jgi:hypothetical protein
MDHDERSSVELLLDETISFDRAMSIIAERHRDSFPARSQKRATLLPATPLTESDGIALLTQAIQCVRPDLDRVKPIKQRVRAFWAGVVAARGAPSALAHAQFLELALDSGLFADLTAADTTIEHLLRWGLLGRDPFGKV